MMITVPVKVYYNDNAEAMFRGYEHGDNLTLIFDDSINLHFGADADIARSIRNTTFACLNDAISPDAAAIPLYRRMALRYRDGRIRSMSVGDVIVIGENAWACASLGWIAIALEARF